MAKFNTPIVTKQGHIYMTKSLDQITSTKFSKAEASSHIYQPSELEDLTDLEDVVLKDTWPTTDILNKSTIHIKTHFDNAVLTETVKVGTIGLWAISAVDGTEFLYAVATAKEAQAYQLDAYTGDGIEELNLEVSLAFSNTDKVEAVVAPDPSSFVTKDFITDMETKTHARETYEPITEAGKAHKQLQDNLDDAVSKINSDANSNYNKLSGIIETNAKTASDDAKAAKNEAIQTAKDYSDDQDSINLSNAKAYTDKVSTDDNAATLASAKSYTDSVSKSNSSSDKAYTDAQVKANSTADQAYTDAQVKANSTADQKYAKDYADKGDSSTLASAKAYSDTQDATNLAAAKTYSDMVGTNTLASAKSYSDDKDTAQTASLKSFTSDSVKTLSDTVNSSYVHNTGTETIDGSKTFTQPVSAVIKPSVIATGTNIDNYFVPGLSVANGVTVSGTGINPATLTGGVVNLGSVEHNTATQILFRSTTDYSVSGSFYVRSWRSGAWSGWNNIPYVSDLNNALDTVANTYQTKANAATDKTTADATYAKKTDIASTYATKADNAKKITTLKVNGNAQAMDSSGVVSISVPSAEDLADIQKTIEGVKETLQNGDIKDLNDGLNKIQTDLKTKLSGVTLNGTAGTVTNNVAALSLDMSQFATTDKIKAAVDDLEIGGTNLLTGTGNHTVTGTGTSGDLSNEDADALLALFKGLEGQTVTLSVGYEYSGFITGSGRNRLGWEIQMVADTITYQTLWYYPDNDSGSGTLHATFVVPKNITKIGYAIGYIQFSGSGTGTLSHLKLEKGSKATDWSPAPEDALLYTDTAVSNLATKDAVSSVQADVKSKYEVLTSSVNNLSTSKQDKLVAGTNIMLDDSTISSTYAVDDGLDKLTDHTLARTPYAGVAENLLVGTSSEWQSATAAANYNLFKTLIFGDNLRRLAGKTLTASVLINNTSSVPVRVQYWSSDTGVVSGNNIASGSTGISRVTFTAVNTTSSPNIVIAEKNLSTNAETVNYSTAKLQEGSVDETGMNLLMGTKDFNEMRWVNTPSWSDTGEKYNGLSIFSATNHKYGGLGQHFTVVAGKQYTFSVFARAEGTSELGIFTINGNAAVVNPPQQFIEALPGMARYHLTFTATTDGDIVPRFENVSGTGTLYVAGYALKEGTDRTYSPSPYDYAPNQADDNYYAWLDNELTNYNGQLYMKDSTHTGTVKILTPPDIAGKQTKLTAGDGITIDDNAIIKAAPATDTVIGGVTTKQISEQVTTNGASVLASAKAYTDTSVKPLATAASVTSLTSTVANNLTTAKSYTDTAVKPLATTAALNTLTSTVASNKTTAKSQADSALTSAKAYTDTSVKPLATAASVSSLSSTVATNKTAAQYYTDNSVSTMSTTLKAVVTQSANGMMSAADKKKLDSMQVITLTKVKDV